MTRDIKWRAGLLAAAGGGLLLATVSLGHGEVSRSAPPPAAEPTEEYALVPPDQAGLRTQCWQEGVKIIDQVGLHGLALNENLKQQTLTFQGAGGTQPRTLILPLANALCMIQADR